MEHKRGNLKTQADALSWPSYPRKILAPQLEDIPNQLQEWDFNEYLIQDMESQDQPLLAVLERKSNSLVPITADEDRVG